MGKETDPVFKMGCTQTVRDGPLFLLRGEGNFQKASCTEKKKTAEKNHARGAMGKKTTIKYSPPLSPQKNNGHP